MASTDGRSSTATACNTLTRSGHAAVEVHSVDTNTRVVLDTEINVFADTEAEVSSLGEIALAEFVFLDLEATLDDFLSLGTSDSDMHGDLLVTTDTEGSDSVAGLAWSIKSEDAADEISSLEKEDILYTGV